MEISINNNMQKYLNYKNFLPIKDMAVAIRVTVVHDFYELNNDKNYEVDQYMILGLLGSDRLEDLIDQVHSTYNSRNIHTSQSNNNNYYLNSDTFRTDFELNGYQVSNLLNSNCMSFNLLDEYNENTKQNNNNNNKDIYVSRIIPGNSSTPSSPSNIEHIVDLPNTVKEVKEIKVIIRYISGVEIIRVSMQSIKDIKIPLSALLAFFVNELEISPVYDIKFIFNKDVLKNSDDLSILQSDNTEFLELNIVQNLEEITIPGIEVIVCNCSHSYTTDCASGIIATDTGLIRCDTCFCSIPTQDEIYDLNGDSYCDHNSFRTGDLRNKFCEFCTFRQLITKWDDLHLKFGYMDHNCISDRQIESKEEDMNMEDKLMHICGSSSCVNTKCRKYIINKTNYTITNKCEFPPWLNGTCTQCWKFNEV